MYPRVSNCKSQDGFGFLDALIVFMKVCNKIYQQFLQLLLNDFKQRPPSQEWSDFLDAAAEGPTLSPSNEQEEHMVVEKSTTSTSSSEDDLSPLRHSLQTCTISYSPLVAGSLETESPYDSGYLALTPTCKRQSSTFKEELSSPLPDTPCMPSPPRSVRVLSTISESSYVSTPSELQTFLQENAAPHTPKSEDLLTPEYLTCNNHLVFETPPVKVRQDEQLHDGLFVPQTPGFGTSPPRTCVPLRPGENIPVASATLSQTPSLPSPFRTPGKNLVISLHLLGRLTILVEPYHQCLVILQFNGILLRGVGRLWLSIGCFAYSII
jgi:hypothetical protein